MFDVDVWAAANVMKAPKGLGVGEARVFGTALATSSRPSCANGPHGAPASKTEENVSVERDRCALRTMDGLQASRPNYHNNFAYHLWKPRRKERRNT